MLLLCARECIGEIICVGQQGICIQQTHTHDFKRCNVMSHAYIDSQHPDIFNIVKSIDFAFQCVHA